MADKRNYRSRYMYGTEARELAEPVRREPENVQRRRNLSQEEQRQQLSINYAEENIKSPSKIGVLYTVFIVAAVAITFLVCSNYIMNINQSNEKNARILALQEELNTLRENNNQKKLSIDTSVDYNYIYDVAIKELGMIHAGSENVIKYESGESEYVIQYDDITSNEYDK